MSLKFAYRALKEALGTKGYAIWGSASAIPALIGFFAETPMSTTTGLWVSAMAVLLSTLYFVVVQLCALRELITPKIHISAPIMTSFPKNSAEKAHRKFHVRVTNTSAVVLIDVRLVLKEMVNAQGGVSKEANRPFKSHLENLPDALNHSYTARFNIDPQHFEDFDLVEYDEKTPYRQLFMCYATQGHKDISDAFVRIPADVGPHRLTVRAVGANCVPTERTFIFHLNSDGYLEMTTAAEDSGDE